MPVVVLPVALPTVLLLPVLLLPVALPTVVLPTGEAVPPIAVVLDRAAAVGCA